ncbi:cytochrome P450 [Paenibacillus sp. FSL H8-0317]|uniref:cytochrome P450 n=1 Tax=Paenibacillus sp. FSL H8-0317 TaxID=2921385 RepID=UPI00324979F1
MSIPVIDVNDPTTFYNENFFGNPYDVYRQLIQQGEIHKVNLYGGLWYIGGYETVNNYIADPRISHNTAQQYWAVQFSEQQLYGILEFIRLFSMWMSLQDGTSHIRYRKMLTQAFSVSVKNLAPYIMDLIDDSLDEMEGKEEVDLIRDYAYPLPTKVIMKLLGLPEEQYERVAECADSLVHLFGSMTVTYEDVTRAQNLLVLLTAYLTDVIEERKIHPQEDFITYLIEATDDDGVHLTIEEIHAQCAMLLFAGHETTRNLIGNGMFTLMKHPEQLQKLKDSPGLIKSTIQEVLRYESPAQITVRTALEDMEILDQQIKKGELIMFCFGSANHDPRKFTDPHLFDIERNEARNLAFGVGIHSCIGAQLAMMETEIAMSRLIARYPHMEWIQDEPEWLPNVGFRGLQRLLVRLNNR